MPETINLMRVPLSINLLEYISLMKLLKIDIEVEFYSYEELSAADRELVDNAIEATDNAYAKYSHFYVGSAIRLADGRIVRGANQENAAFPSGLCAERTAIFSAQAHFPNQAIQTIAVAARNDNGLLKRPVTPCGACRQVMIEMEDRYNTAVRVLLYGTEGVYAIKTVRNLLPLSFIDADMRG